jgi:hypothetical protein
MDATLMHSCKSILLPLHSLISCKNLQMTHIIGVYLTMITTAKMDYILSRQFYVLIHPPQSPKALQCHRFLFHVLEKSHREGSFHLI